MMNDRNAARRFALISIVGAVPVLATMIAVLVDVDPAHVAQMDSLELLVASVGLCFAVWGLAHLPFYVATAWGGGGTFFSGAEIRRRFWTRTVWLNGIWAVIAAASTAGDGTCLGLMFAGWFFALAFSARGVQMSLGRDRLVPITPDEAPRIVMHRGAV